MGWNYVKNPRLISVHRLLVCGSRWAPSIKTRSTTLWRGSNNVFPLLDLIVPKAFKNIGYKIQFGCGHGDQYLGTSSIIQFTFHTHWNHFLTQLLSAHRAICQGTMLEWCLQCGNNQISSPFFQKRVNHWLLNLYHEVSSEVKIISCRLSCIKNAFVFFCRACH